MFWFLACAGIDGPPEVSVDVPDLDVAVLSLQRPDAAVLDPPEADTGTGPRRGVHDGDFTPLAAAPLGPWEPFDRWVGGRWDLATWTLGSSELAPDNVDLDGGQLDLRHRLVGHGWTGAELYTSAELPAGRWTARIAPPEASGTVCGFFFYGRTDESEGALVHEIDVELLEGRLAVGTYAAWTESDGYDTSPTREVAWIDTDTSGFHEYTIRWTQDEVAFDVDGREVAAFHEAIPLAPLSMHLNHWTSSKWLDTSYPPEDNLSCRFDWIDGGP